MNKEVTFKAKVFLLDLLFPKFCLGCGLEGGWLCPACQDQILLVKTQVCPTCERVSSGGRFCRKCRQKKYLSGIIVSAYYGEGPTKELIHNLKYHGILELSDFLGEMLAGALAENPPAKDMVLSFVPLHFLREKQRGFNQAEILTKVVAQRLKLPKARFLRKIRFTKRQVDLKGQERRKNLKNVFRVLPVFDPKGKTIVLVDDITTTGTTLEECARALKEAGAKRVWGLVAARG